MLNVMRRRAFKMYLKEGMKEEYKRRHDKIWPELIKLLVDSGIKEYSIFLDEESNTLFGFQKVSGDKSSQDMGDNEVVKKWWKYMADIMEVNPDNSPVSIPVEELFYLEGK
jgi:L-rhamnose mutarotase